jgi:translocation and assembly module TamB
MVRRALLCTVLIATPALAQEDDRGFLTAFLEDNLSDAGRSVTITGFEGALSSQATIQSLTIADDTGVWLTLNGVVLDWSRSSLLGGALVVSELSADSIILDRVPETSADPAAPAPEASGFTLPELPVSVEIGQIAADEIVLGPTVLGQAVRASLSASLSLSGGEGTATVDLVRIDGQDGEIILDASYSNATRQLELSLTASEEAGGIVATAAGLPGAPETTAEITGSGPIEDFAATLRLATGGEDRLSGTVNLSAVEGGAYRLRADVGGNLAPLLLPDQQDFFGDDVGLTLDATRAATGALAVDRFSLDTQALRISGEGRISADGLPETLAVSGTLAAPDGSPVLLPFGDTSTSVGRAEFHLSTSRSEQTAWRLSARIDGLTRSDLDLAALTIDGSGRIGRTPAGNAAGGTFQVSVAGLALADPSLAQALGESLELGFKLHRLEGSGTTNLTDLALSGPGLSATGGLRIEGLEQAFRTSGRLEVAADDLARFSALAGRPLGGSATIQAEGAASSLSGEIDGVISIDGQRLSLGIPQVDALLAQDSGLSASVLRDMTGTRLRSLELAAGPLTATASGTIASSGSDLSGQITMADLAPLGPGYGGQAALAFRFTGTETDGRVTLDGTASGLRSGNARLDPLLAGQTLLDATLVLAEGAPRVETLDLSNPQLTLAARTTSPGRLQIDGRLANLALFVPDLPGPLSLSGTLADIGQELAIDLALRGPGQIDARLGGSLSPSSQSADLALSGSGRAALANLFIAPRSVDGTVRYDLALRGPLQLSSLSGRVTLSQGRITDPGLGLALTDLEAIGQLGQGSLRLSATSQLSSGGQLRVDGPIALTGGFQADLALALQDLRLYDPELFDTRISGALTIAGPLAGGARIGGTLTLAETEIQVPSTGFASAAALMDIRHRNEPQAVRITRQRAGLLDQGGSNGSGAASGPDYPLAITILAPNQIFIRGRGIDAELGGQLTLGGTTRNVVPSGAFDLIRGRLDILGTRLVLDRASLQLEGSFTPLILVSASTQNGGITSTVTVQGPADDPEVTFTSSPELPQEEVLAQLLFGRGLENLSAFQALQLANAVATLAGRGGEGVVSRLRRSFGLDDLDIVADGDGSAALRAGKYISENVYTEVEVQQGGQTRLNLNLDLREGVTVKGRVGADGETGIGIFIERDY